MLFSIRAQAMSPWEAKQAIEKAQAPQVVLFSMENNILKLEFHFTPRAR